jgi:hypothetical protein
MHFSNGTLSLMVLVSLGLTLFLTLVLAPAALRERRMRRRRRDPGDRRLNAVVIEHARSIQRLEAAIRQLALGQKQLGELAGEAVRHVAVVRFDAFEDMGGRLSFSAAILDGRGDGMVITSINGRQDTRVYAKAVSNGASAHNLSDEEHQALRLALGKKDRLVLAEAVGPRRVAEGGE